MSKIAIFYGSSTGNTENVSKTIAKKLNADLYNVADNPIDKILEYDNLIFGSSTWGIGDLQGDWEGFLPELAKANLSGKTVAIFGLGDSCSYGESFVDAIGLIYEAIENKGCKIVGKVDALKYNFDTSKAIEDGFFVGLPLDEDNESNLTSERIDKWIEELSKHF